MFYPKPKYPSFFLRRQQGLTLIELITVVAVIAILAMLIVPVLSSQRESSSRIRCASNLRGIFAGMMLFSHDHDGGILRWIDQDARATSPDQSYDSFWSGVLVQKGYLPDAKDSSLWQCPSNPGLLSPGEVTAYDKSSLFNNRMTYAINAVSNRFSKDGKNGPSMVTQTSPRYHRNQLHDIDPATTIALCDGKSWLIFEGDGGAYKATAGNWHGGGMNAVFWDGHVQFFEKPLPNSHRYFSISAD